MFVHINPEPASAQVGLPGAGSCPALSRLQQTAYGATTACSSYLCPQSLLSANTVTGLLSLQNCSTYPKSKQRVGVCLGKDRPSKLKDGLPCWCCVVQESLCSLKFAAKVNGCETAARGGAKRNVTQGAAAAAPALVSVYVQGVLAACMCC